MSSDTAVVVKNLKKGYPKSANSFKRLISAASGKAVIDNPFWALNDISFEIAKGESVGILGTNGSGKSTLLQIIAGTCTPTSGSVSTYGTVAGILELGAGFLPDLTGRENALLNAKILGMSQSEAIKKLPWIEEFAEIGDHFDMPVRGYSSGMFVRLAFAVAASVNPDILIVDEAMAVGDITFQQKCYAHMRTTMSSATRLFVTHDVGILPSICERSIVIDKGTIVFDGPTKDAVIHYLRRAHAPRISTEPDGNILQSSLSGPREIDIERVSIDRDSLGGIAPGDKIKIDVAVNSKKDDVRYLVVGMHWTDETGRIIFDRNTADQKIPLRITPGRSVASIEFIWPRLHPGTYECTIGVADTGHMDDPYVLQCWAHKAISVSSINTEEVRGILAVDLDAARI